MKKQLLVFVLPFVTATSVCGQTMFGEANTDCIDFLNRNKQEVTIASVDNWLKGYFSGRVRETQRDLEIIDHLNIPIYALLIKACEEDPNLKLHQAADNIYFMIP